MRCDASSVSLVKFLRTGLILVVGIAAALPQQAAAEPVPVLQVGPGALVTSLCFSPDGKSLAAGSEDKAATIWDLGSGKIRNVFRPGIPAAVKYSPDGRKVAAAVAGGVRIWDAGTGKPQQSLPVRANAIAFSPDSALLAVASLKPLALWNVGGGEEVMDYGATSAGARCLALTPNGKAIISGHDDGIVRIWDVEKGSSKGILTGERGRTECLSLSPDSSLIAAGSGDGKVYVWSSVKRKLLRILPTQQDDRINSIAFDHSGDIAAVVTDSGRLQFWNVKSGQRLSSVAAPGGAKFTAVAFSGSGSQIAAACGQVGTPGIVELWSVPGSGTGHAQAWIRASDVPVAVLKGKADGVTCIASSPDGKMLAAGAGTVLRLWDAQTGVLKNTLLGDSLWVQRVAWSPDNRLVACGGTSGTIRIYDAQQGKQISQVSPFYVWKQIVYTQVVFSPDGTLIAAANGPREIRIWSVGAGKLVKVLSLPAKVVTDVLAIAPDNHTIAVGSGIGADAYLYDLETGVLRSTLKGHSKSLLALAFSPDGKTLATGGWDRVVRLWDGRTGQAIAALKVSIIIRNIAFSTTGDDLILGALSGRVMILNPATKVASPLPAGPVTGVPAGILRPMFADGGGVIIHSPRTGSILATMYPVPDGTKPGAMSWFIQTPQGYFTCPDAALQYLMWSDAGNLLPAERYSATYRRPELVQKTLEESGETGAGG